MGNRDVRRELLVREVTTDEDGEIVSDKLSTAGEHVRYHGRRLGQRVGDHITGGIIGAAATAILMACLTADRPQDSQIKEEPNTPAAASTDNIRPMPEALEPDRRPLVPVHPPAESRPLVPVTPIERLPPEDLDQQQNLDQPRPGIRIRFPTRKTQNR
ncbi:MAG: hypothetical protein GF416_02780 [Candidatus Altiarchaeales archaeon]|nr:hypothetical protein [Candidatus Altiarchaeales archaeon]MBD3416044.1 hypothetical protein [Candidatus Altiarchaeales archaeon]